MSAPKCHRDYLWTHRGRLAGHHRALSALLPASRSAHAATWPAVAAPCWPSLSAVQYHHTTAASWPTVGVCSQPKPPLGAVSLLRSACPTMAVACCHPGLISAGVCVQTASQPDVAVLQCHPGHLCFGPTWPSRSTFRIVQAASSRHGGRLTVPMLPLGPPWLFCSAIQATSWPAVAVAIRPRLPLGAIKVIAKHLCTFVATGMICSSWNILEVRRMDKVRDLAGPAAP
jgi:hypothetical protein